MQWAHSSRCAYLAGLLRVQKQTSISEGSMSALPLKTDIHRHDGDVRFVPEADNATAAVSRRRVIGRYLFDWPVE
jgi:hypothetical protein